MAKKSKIWQPFEIVDDDVSDSLAVEESLKTTNDSQSQMAVTHLSGSEDSGVDDRREALSASPTHTHLHPSSAETRKSSATSLLTGELNAANLALLVRAQQMYSANMAVMNAVAVQQQHQRELQHQQQQHYQQQQQQKQQQQQQQLHQQQQQSTLHRPTPTISVSSSGIFGNSSNSWPTMSNKTSIQRPSKTWTNTSSISTPSLPSALARPVALNIVKDSGTGRRAKSQVSSPINMAVLPLAALPAVSFAAHNCCADCGAVFRLTSDLVQHMRTHHRRTIGKGARSQTSDDDHHHQKHHDNHPHQHNHPQHGSSTNRKRSHQQTGDDF